jgi:4-hydroxyacetophenone monooxygenase
MGPAIADSVDQLHIFQRSGNWIAKRPKISEPVSASTTWLLHNIPYYSEWSRFRLFWAFGDSMLEAFKIDPNWTGGKESISEVNAKYRSVFVRHIQRELEGRDDLLKKAIPPYPPFCKRVIADPGWYTMLRRSNVNLVEAGIERVSRDAIHTSDGGSYVVDLIVFATGFRADRMLGSLDIRGRNGRSLRSVWGTDNPRAYLGITVPEFPNLFLLYGPNSNFAHGGSAIFMAECQVNYVVDMLKLMMQNGHAAVEIRKEVHDRYNDHLDEELRKLAWSNPSIPSWYKNAEGRIVANQPWRLVDYWRLTRRAKADDYTFAGGKS